MSDWIHDLLKPFPPQYIKELRGFSYTAWQMNFLRLMAVLGYNWDYEVKQSSLTVHPEKDPKGRTQYLAQATVRLTLRLPDGTITVREGTGADVKIDPDHAIKTAQSSGFAKAAMAVGMSMEYGYANEARMAYAKAAEVHEWNDERIERLQASAARLAELEEGDDG